MTFESLESPKQDLSFREAKASYSRRNCTKIWGSEMFHTAGGGFNNLALIISDQCPWTCEIRCDGTACRELTGSVIGQLNVVEGTVTEIRRRISAESEEGLPRIPAMVLTEVVLNAISHRSYCCPDPVVVDLVRGGIRVSSPGGMMRIGVSYRERSRNPLLTMMLEDMGFKNPAVHGAAGLAKAYRYA